VTLRDAWRKKLFIASAGLQLSSESGTISSVTVNATTIRVEFSSASTQPLVSSFRLRVDQTAVESGKRAPLAIKAMLAGGKAPLEVRGAWEFDASEGTMLELLYSKAE
jgi:hypothetical protein